VTCPICKEELVVDVGHECRSGMRVTIRSAPVDPWALVRDLADAVAELDPFGYETADLVPRARAALEEALA
jgi:hypothetical protein